MIKNKLHRKNESEIIDITNAFFSSNRTDRDWENIVQRGFFGYFCEANKETEAIKTIKMCRDPKSQEGRIHKFNSINEFSNYKGEIAKTPELTISNKEKEYLDEPKEPGADCTNFEILRTDKFKDALYLEF